MTATQPEGFDMTDELIKVTLTKAGIGFYASGAIAGDKDDLFAAIRALLSASKPALPMGMRVTDQGIQFGNAWYSHEKITGYTTEQLNAGDCRVTGRAYVAWLQETLAASPAPPAQSAEPVAWRHKWANGVSSAWQYEIAGPQTDKLRLGVPGILNQDSARTQWEPLYAAPLENGAPVSREEVERARDRILEQSKNSLFRSGVKICATEILSPTEQCNKPPEGWTCSRVAGHEGPCAASPQPSPTAVVLDETNAKRFPTPISISTDKICEIAGKYNLGNPRIDALRGFVNEVIIVNEAEYAKSE